MKELPTYSGIKVSNVEQAFIDISGIKKMSTKIPYITVDNFPKLGLFTALRFLEWALENPSGVISLPTGKTPEFFIKWTKHFLDNWNEKKARGIREEYGLSSSQKPDLSQLQFIQIDEFYPISPAQHNSFTNYVRKYYLDFFGMNHDNALLMDCDKIPLPDGKAYSEVFPDFTIDLSLRYRDAKNNIEELQQRAIFLIDNWCGNYEQGVREKGGIGFFLGGIGPDGHIAFNVRGSSHYSPTRLTSTNFETQAVAAADLGGIEISKQRLVITIGLETITHNPEATAIIIAAGEAKADIVKKSIESEPSNVYPASVLAKLKNSKFYITNGAAASLSDTVDAYYKTGDWTDEKSERAIINLCKRLDKFGHHLSMDDLKEDEYCCLIPELSLESVNNVINSFIAKIDRGMAKEQNQRFLHTGPHHDDVMLGLLPTITQHVRQPSNSFRFSVLTSGFTAVTNSFLAETLEQTRKLLNNGEIEMAEYPDFFESGYKFKWDKDVYHFLNKVAQDDDKGKVRGLCHRMVRGLVEITGLTSKDELREKINEILATIRKNYDGEKNTPEIQKIKGLIREFEEELVWAHFGIQVKDITHNRLGFYTGDIFTEQPEKARDVEPVLKMLKEIDPTVVSLAFDPEGSGPDTHYKVLQTIAEALRLWSKEKDLSKLRIWGYRNVWYRFSPSEANVIVPTSLNSLFVLNNAFNNCYLSQVDASFPSPEHDGTFSKLSQKIWVEQMKDMQLLLGKNWFYQNKSPKLRSSHGMVFFSEMSLDEFLSHARELEKSMEGFA